MKNKFNGIGDVSASLTFAYLQTNPSTAFLTKGILGQITFSLLSNFFSFLANKGLLLMNIGASRLETALAENEFDGSFESAEKMIRAIQEKGLELTPEEIKKIDDPVIIAFRRFAKLGGKNKGKKK